MAVSEAQKRASKKYFDNNYRQVKLSMSIKEAEALEAASGRDFLQVSPEVYKYALL